MVILNVIIDEMNKMCDFGMWRPVVFRIVEDEPCPALYGSTIINARHKNFPLKKPKDAPTYFDTTLDRYFLCKACKNSDYIVIKDVFKDVIWIFRQIYSEQIMYTCNGNPELALNCFIEEVTRYLEIQLTNINKLRFPVRGGVARAEKFIKFAESPEKVKEYGIAYRRAMDMCAFTILFANAIDLALDSVHYKYHLTNTMLCKILHTMATNIYNICLADNMCYRKDVLGDNLCRKMFDHIIDAFNDFRLGDANEREYTNEMFKGAIRKAQDDVIVERALRQPSDLVSYRDSFDEEDEKPVTTASLRDEAEWLGKMDEFTCKYSNTVVEPYQGPILSSFVEDKNEERSSDEQEAPSTEAYCDHKLSTGEKSDNGGSLTDTELEED